VLFEALYAGRGHPLSGHFLRKQSTRRLSASTSIKLRRALVGSRYRVETRRGDEYELDSGRSVDGYAEVTLLGWRFDGRNKHSRRYGTGRSPL